MAFVDKDFVTLTVLTEADLDNLNGNDKHLRAEIHARSIAGPTGPCVLRDSVTVSGGTSMRLRLRALIAGIEILSNEIVVSDATWTAMAGGRNADVHLLADDTLHVGALWLQYRRTSSGSWFSEKVFEFRYWKTADQDFMSLFGEAYSEELLSADDFKLAVRSIQVVTSRLDESF